MDGFIEKSLKARRSMKKALGDLLANYQNHPTPRLARTIKLLQAEIELRERGAAPALALASPPPMDGVATVSSPGGPQPIDDPPAAAGA